MHFQRDYNTCIHISLDKGGTCVCLVDFLWESTSWYSWPTVAGNGLPWLLNYSKLSVTGAWNIVLNIPNITSVCY